METSRLSLRTATWIVAALTLVLMLVAAVSPIRLVTYVNDGLTCLEGAWRIRQGMRPHQDFYSPLGPFYLYMLDAGLWMAGLSHRAFAYAAAVYLPFVVAASWFVFARRFSVRTAFVLTAVQALTVVAPFSLGDFAEQGDGRMFQMTTYGMQYNRFLWPLAMVTVVVCLLAPIRRGRRDEIVEGLLVGVAALLMFYGKLNYFVGCFPIILYGLYRRRGLWSGGVVAGGVATLAFFAALGVSLGAYIADVRQLAKAQSSLHLLGSMTSRSLSNVALFAALGVGFLLFYRAYAEEKALRPYFVAVGALMLYGVFVTGGNYQATQVPALIFAAVLLAEGALRPTPSDDSAVAQSRGMARGAALAVTAAAVGSFVLVSGAGIVYPFVANGISPAYAPPANTAVPVFRGTTIAQNMGYAAKVYSELEEQAALIDRACPPGARVSSLTWFNVLPVSRGRPSPGGLLWYHEGHTVSEDTMPPAEREFATTDAIVVRKNPKAEGMDSLVIATYTGYLKRHFVYAAESKNFAVWVRRPRLESAALPKP